MIFFDTTYLVRLYLDDKGCEEVRELAARQPLAGAWHAQAELLCTFHRALREGRLDAAGYQAQRGQFFRDQASAAFVWLPLSDETLKRLERVLAGMPVSVYLRAADAFHLACAAEHGFTEVYSNDRHLLAASAAFGLRGVNVIGNRGS